MSMTEIIVRYPKIDYSGMTKRWVPNLAFCHDRNASGIIPSPVEPWLIKVLQGALPRIPESEAGLRQGIEAFIGQESQHFRQHRQYIKALVDLGYVRLPEFEKQLADDLERFLKTRSLKFLLAYADGFESLGAVSGAVWFEDSEDMIGGVDNAAVRLWKWHMAEEFEHREVCFELFRALYGRGFFKRIINGYFYRLYGFVFAMWHLKGFAERAVKYMREVDCAEMSETERSAFETELKAFNRFNARVFLKPLLANFLPWYDPGKKPVPRGLFDYLRKFDGGGEWSAKAARPVPA
jgi:predicted metal-dependent hydrolase